MDPKDDPSRPEFYRVAQTGSEPALPPPKPELTFSGQQGSAVLGRVLRRPIPLDGLVVDQRVIVPTIFGYYEATVTWVESDYAGAETKDLFFLFWPKDGAWWCDNATSKDAIKSMTGKALLK